ncbi:MAG TPA: methyltransferase domain-containing protein [Ignavibacteria bacterium]|nr:methyltransferase domain-containing protein [Ignavibacteria bacterium]
MDIFYEIHKDLPREGPGDNASTRKALSYLKNLPKDAKILDIGCGPGMQTLELAKNLESTSCKIIALDNHEPFLKVVDEKAKKENLSEKIQTHYGSMFSLEFEDESFDCIWAEGSIYIIGFKRGIKEWKNFLKEGGYLVVSEISWLKFDVPEEAKEFWSTKYPVKQIYENLHDIKESGYEIIEHFTLPSESWRTDYYTPIENRITSLWDKYINDQEAMNVLYDTQQEINMFNKYSDYYGYVFYVMRVKN